VKNQHYSDDGETCMMSKEAPVGWVPKFREKKPDRVKQETQEE